ncbi:MAG: hypothetical protein ACP5JL_03360 [bacterium]
MCIIAVCISRKLSKGEMEFGWERNPHGSGIGWSENGRVNYIKGLMHLEDFKKEYERIGILPHIVHFRYASSGMKINPKLTHPFIVSEVSPIRLRYKGQKPIIFHNGTIEGWKDYYESFIKLKFRKDSLSDTRIMAMVWAERKEETFKIFNPGRVAILLPSGEIKRYGEWVEKEGIYLSNSQLIG